MQAVRTSIVQISGRSWPTSMTTSHTLVRTAYACVHIHIHIIYICKYKYMYTHICIYTNGHIRMFIYACTCIHILLCNSMYMCVQIYLYSKLEIYVNFIFYKQSYIFPYFKSKHCLTLHNIFHIEDTNTSALYVIRLIYSCSNLLYFYTVYSFFLRFHFFPFFRPVDDVSAYRSTDRLSK